MISDAAKARYMAIQAVRWIGVALALLGLLVIRGRIELPPEAGYVLFVVGLFDALFMPTILARRWKSPPP